MKEGNVSISVVVFTYERTKHGVKTHFTLKQKKHSVHAHASEHHPVPQSAEILIMYNIYGLLCVQLNKEFCYVGSYFSSKSVL